MIAGAKSKSRYGADNRYRACQFADGSLSLLAATTALQSINRDDNIGPLKYLDQPIKQVLVVMRSRLEIFFEDALCVAHGLKR
jgi:hypothetical protein